MNPLVLLLPLLIVLTWARLIRPGFTKLQGTLIMVVPLPLLARVRMHAIPVVLAIGLAIWLATLGAIPWWIALVPVVSGALLIAIPVKYTLTDIGIRLGWTLFRRWTEFAGVRRAPGGANLAGVHNSMGMRIWLSGSRGDDEFLQFLRHTVKNAYKGKSEVIPFPVDRAVAGHVGESDPMENGLSAYTSER